jgi:CBS domain-containing protein
MQAIESILKGKDGAVRTVAPEATVLKAVETMSAARVGALLVMEGDRLAGVFSERDLMTRVVLELREPSRTRVGDVMTREIVCIGVGDTPYEAMALMTDRRVRHLPVVDRRRVVGVVSIGDLIRWTVRDREHEIADLGGYVEGRYPG